MAKATGIIGTIHGRSGNMVFSKGPNGSTIMRPYQPVVANPKTKGQVEQRAKVNAAGRFSRLWAKSALAPLGGTALSNRSKFNKALINNAKLTISGTAANIVPDLVEFSDGAQPTVLMDLAISAAASTGGRSNITLTGKVPAHTPAGIARVYLAFIPSADCPVPASGVMVSMNIPANNTDNEVAFTMSLRGLVADDVEDPIYSSRYHMWLVSWTPTNEGGRQVYNRLITLANNDGYITAEVDDITASNGNFSKTAYVGSVQPPLAGGE